MNPTEEEEEEEEEEEKEEEEEEEENQSFGVSDSREIIPGLKGSIDFNGTQSPGAFQSKRFNRSTEPTDNDVAGKCDCLKVDWYRNFRI